MKLDLVYDIQQSYRKVLNCMSRPGLIENINEQSEKIDIYTNFYSSTLLLMFMLLDAEVNFYIVTEDESEIKKIVNQLSYAKSTDIKDADFIFILNDARAEQIEEAFLNAKTGTLMDPQKSATIIFETKGLKNEEGLILKGPGIKDEAYAKIDAKSNWINYRDKKNIEYPLGIDIIFVDVDSNIMCLPRTTKVEKQVVK
ncbi:alpha-D-ribose 1-methylphosphonate 5-triphosphate synthase subunit PhnH [Oxobacter pfennigii]|uniref:Alpha-D-ribose 1-methylphosphonate 5-triphosphate synthase subunit PhnH n=1 Tax=Oxobacter pfennigii TaxID=36849 RepID=A0A0N8NSP3_9CLOT|nr:phosphonate C-P lyase system protein PhnH [Oxobacter pfennigii]KPU42592.1 alpha-D-ribose 1-methylphosphonate 5-triphosphate synthase subunit PhnH [Oxobacter pfennigii]